MTTAMSVHLLLGNPSAQSGEAGRSIARVEKLLAAKGIRAEVVHTQPEGKTPKLVQAAIDVHRPSAVLALGGDGTFNEVARGILASGFDLPMGVLPMGTANDQGKSFGIPTGPSALEAQVEIIAKHFVKRIDVGNVRAIKNGEAHARATFFDSLSFGLAPDILAVRNRDREDIKRVPLLAALYRDQAVYVGAALNRFLTSFIEPTTFDAVIETDRFDETRKGITDLVIKATPIFAGEWVLERRAEVDDGLFELVAVGSRREWIERVVGDLSLNPFRPAALGLPTPAHLAASQFTLHFYRGSLKHQEHESKHSQIASQVDGEEWVRGDHFEVDVDRKRLQVIVPEGFVPPWR